MSVAWRFSMGCQNIYGFPKDFIKRLGSRRKVGADILVCFLFQFDETAALRFLISVEEISRSGAVAYTQAGAGVSGSVFACDSGRRAAE